MFNLPVYCKGAILTSIKQSWLMTSLICLVQKLSFNIRHLFL